jgi:hypothetical protein
MNEHRFQNIADAHAYIQSGKAVVTLTSRKTEKHYTYKVKRAKDNDQLYFVSVLGGEDQSFNYLGILKKEGFFVTKKSSFTAESTCAKAFNYFVKLKTLPFDLQVQHEGTCGCCGRRLTHPDSIDKGIGPECAKRVRVAPVIEISEMHEMRDYDA